MAQSEVYRPHKYNSLDSDYRDLRYFLILMLRGPPQSASAPWDTPFMMVGQVWQVTPEWICCDTDLLKQHFHSCFMPPSPLSYACSWCLRLISLLSLISKQLERLDHNTSVSTARPTIVHKTPQLDPLLFRLRALNLLVISAFVLENRLRLITRQFHQRGIRLWRRMGVLVVSSLIMERKNLSQLGHMLQSPHLRSFDSPLVGIQNVLSMIFRYNYDQSWHCQLVSIMVFKRAGYQRHATELWFSAHRKAYTNDWIPKHRLLFTLLHDPLYTSVRWPLQYRMTAGLWIGLNAPVIPGPLFAHSTPFPSAKCRLV